MTKHDTLNMNKVFYIDGGAGRVIAAIPALLKYHKLNPDNTWCVLIPGWHYLYWGIPGLHERTYDAEQKGVFDVYIKHANEFVAPEPYRLPAYYRQEVSLSQAFDRLINSTQDHSDLGAPMFTFNKAETHWAQTQVAQIAQAQGKSKTILIQPFGRGCRIDAGAVIDDSTRSLSADNYIQLVQKLGTRYNLIFMGEPDYQITTDTYTHKMPANTDLRMWASLIDQVDYVIGVDSVAQHMARATNTPGTVIFGSTYPINTSYPDWFQIVENMAHKTYSAIRISNMDSQMADRYNDACMNFSEEEMDELYQQIVKHIQQTT